MNDPPKMVHRSTELLERQIEREYNLSAEEAHAKASEVYDWASQIDEETDQKGEADGLL